MPPNPRSCDYNGDNGGGAYTASARHSGNVNMMMADGSVRTIRGSVNLTVWWALGSRGGNEVISQGDY